jgi:amino acid transporter
VRKLIVSPQIYYDALGKDGALAFMIVLCIVQYLIGLSLVSLIPLQKVSIGLLISQIVATSRQAWAFSRDGAFPFSNFFRHISTRIQYQPIRMICGLVVVCLILGLLCLINNAATNALFSLFVASNYLSWGMPIFCRVFWGERHFQPGEFYTGRFSKPIAWIAVIYLLFGVVLSMFPTAGPNPSRMYSHFISLVLTCVC